ncbi:FHA domain-containing protein [Austwickia chelonae]|uniref:FHA domain-containing protein n=1 Tax=Austwickia chelonae TaxID=100225 RepID=UPI000E282CDA
MIDRPRENQSRQQDPMTMRLTSLGDLEAHVEHDRGLSTDDLATIDALRPDTALLLVLRGPNAGARFLLDAPLTTVGRHPDSDIFLDDVTVSRKHALFEQEGDAFVVRDVGSLNGTYVNRERIERMSLRTGDEVQIGKFRLIFYTAPRHYA